MEEGQYSRASQALSSCGIDQSSEEAREAMIVKHPQAELAETPVEDIEEPPPIINNSDVKKAIKSFKAGSAPGPSGMRAEHLKEAISASASHPSHKALNSFTSFLDCYHDIFPIFKCFIIDILQ